MTVAFERYVPFPHFLLAYLVSYMALSPGYLKVFPYSGLGTQIKLKEITR